LEADLVYLWQHKTHPCVNTRRARKEDDAKEPRHDILLHELLQ
jgi:hypothetical protein